MSFAKVHGISLAKNSWIENLRLERVSADPSLAQELTGGRLWFNTTDNTIRYTVMNGASVESRILSDASALSAQITTVQSTLQSQITTVSNGLAQEITDRQAAITTVTNALNDEVAARTAAITQEVTDRNAAIAVAASNAADAVATEAAARLAGDGAATTRMDNIQSELNATQAGAGLAVDGTFVAITGSSFLDTATSLAHVGTLLDSALSAEATTRASAITAVQSALANEAQLRTDGDAALQTQIQAYIDSAITNNVNADNAETAARIAADAAIQSELDATQAAIGLATNGTLIPISGTNYMDTATTVFGAASFLDNNLKRVDDALTAEIATRTSAVAAANTAISTETADRITAVQGVQTELNTTQVGAGLETNGSYAAPTGTNYLNAATSLKDADLKLDSALKSEAERATSAETGLQTQIDSLVASAGDGATALKAQLNNGRYHFQSSTAALTFTITHNLGTSFLLRDIMVEGTDTVWRYDLVAIEEIDSNSFRIDLSDARNIRVSVLSAAALA